MCYNLGLEVTTLIWGIPLNNSESPDDVRSFYNRAMEGPLRMLFGPLGLQGGGWPLLNLERLFGDAASLLEVGCGQGLLLEKALRRLKPRRAVGVDLSDVMLEIAWERLKRRGKTETIQVAHAEATTLPFQDACFDGLLSMSMIEHLDERALMKFMGEARRVLRPGGRLFVWSFSPRSPIVLARQTMTGRSSDELRLLAIQAGFREARSPRVGLALPLQLDRPRLSRVGATARRGSFAVGRWATEADYPTALRHAAGSAWSRPRLLVHHR